MCAYNSSNFVVTKSSSNFYNSHCTFRLSAISFSGVQLSQKYLHSSKMTSEIWKDEFDVLQEQMTNEVGEFSKLDNVLTFASTWKRKYLESVLSLLYRRTGKILAEMKSDPNFVKQTYIKGSNTLYYPGSRDLYRKIYEFHTKLEIAMAKMKP